MKKYLFLLSLLVWSRIGVAQHQKERKCFLPDYTKIQFAGNIGFLSIGIGYQLFNDGFNTELIYGYVPKAYAHTQIHTITTKNIVPLWRIHSPNFIFTPYLGMTLSFETGNSTFVKLPSQYPSGYYSTNAFHFCVLGGISAYYSFETTKAIKGFAFYVETVAVDSFLWYELSSDQVRMSQILSLALGINFYF